MPVRPPAPERDSMTMACPSTVAIFSVKMRLIVSAGPPAGNGTMNFTERFGKSWVIATAGHARTQITHMRRINVNIATDLSPGFSYQPHLLPHAMGVYHLPRHGTQISAGCEGTPQLVDEPHTRIASERSFLQSESRPLARLCGRRIA